MSGQYQIPLERTANTPVTEGIHVFKVTEVEESVSSNDNPMWVATLACQTPGEEGKQVRLYLVLTEKARWKLESFLDAVSAPKSGSAVAENFVGRSLRAQITHEDFEGRPQARIGEMWPMSSTAPANKAPVLQGKPVVTTKPAVGTPAPTGKNTAAVKAAVRKLPQDVAE